MILGRCPSDAFLARLHSTPGARVDKQHESPPTLVEPTRTIPEYGTVDSMRAPLYLLGFASITKRKGAKATLSYYSMIR